MKTLIIKLEPHDDTTSIRDKMGWGKTDRVLLVWPEIQGPLQSKLDLLLLKRHAANLGVQLALVTRVEVIKYFAVETDIPVFTGIQKAQKNRWRYKNLQKNKDDALSQRNRLTFQELRDMKLDLHRPMPRWMTLPITRLLLFTIGVLAILAIAIVLIPSATITIIPQTISREIITDVTTQKDLNSLNYSGKIPENIISITMSGEGKIQTSGTIEAPSMPASGWVVMTNLTDQEIPIPEGLVILSSQSISQKFYIDAPVIIPAGIGESITTTIRAMLPGSSGNIAENSLDAIEDPIGLKFSITNPEPTSGGADRISPSPTTQDRQKIYEQLESSLISSALQEAEQKLDSNDILLRSPNFDIINIEEQYNPSDKTPADFLELKLTLQIGINYIEAEQLDAFSRAVALSNTPSGYEPVEDIPFWEIVSKSEIGSDKSTAMKIKIKQDYQPDLNINQMRNVLVTLPLNAIEEALINHPIQRIVQVQLSPTWWPRMPVIPFRIYINVLPPT